MTRNSIPLPWFFASLAGMDHPDSVGNVGGAEDHCRYLRLDLGQSRLIIPGPWPGRNRKIRTFLIACIAAAAVAIGAAVILHQLQEPAAIAFSTSAVRI